MTSWVHLLLLPDAQVNLSLSELFPATASSHGPGEPQDKRFISLTGMPKKNPQWTRRETVHLTDWYAKKTHSEPQDKRFISLTGMPKKTHTVSHKINGSSHWLACQKKIIHRENSWCIPLTVSAGGQALPINIVLDCAQVMVVPNTLTAVQMKKSRDSKTDCESCSCISVGGFLLYPRMAS